MHRHPMVISRFPRSGVKRFVTIDPARRDMGGTAASASHPGHEKRNVAGKLRTILIVTILFSALLPCGCVQNRSFLTFKDAAPCGDHGDISPVRNPDSIILKFPFLIRLDEEGKIVKESYPRTENEIDKYIVAAIRVRNMVIVPSQQSPYYPVLGKYLQDVVNTVGGRTDSPLEWGRKIPEGTLEKNTYIYFPVGIERESRQPTSARFYVLIGNSEGRIIFARCIPYNPDLWSADIDFFKRDVKGKLPLAD